MITIDQRIAYNGQNGIVCGLDRSGRKLWIKLDSGVTLWTLESNVRAI